MSCVCEAQAEDACTVLLQHLLVLPLLLKNLMQTLSVLAQMGMHIRMAHLPTNGIITNSRIRNIQEIGDIRQIVNIRQIACFQYIGYF